MIVNRRSSEYNRLVSNNLSDQKNTDQNPSITPPINKEGETVELPSLFFERLQQLYSAEQYQKVLAALSQLRPTSFRANTLKNNPAEVLTELKKAGLPVEPVEWWSTAMTLTDIHTRQLVHPLYVAGAVYVQGLSSMIPALILDPKPEESVLDLTAAPGSKTTQMAAMMENTGQIIANELSPVRIFKLQANLRQQGVTNTVVRRMPGQYLWRKFPEYFDKSLVDVPCSMEGRIQLDDPDTFSDWSVKKIKTLSARQQHLLRSAVSATKVGGTIVYSTCTMAPEENEAVIDWLLEREAGKIELEKVTWPGLEDVLQPGMTEWQGKKFSPEVAKTARIAPSETMEGFFVAKIRKLAPSSPQMEEFFGLRSQFNHHRRSSSRSSRFSSKRRR